MRIGALGGQETAAGTFPQPRFPLGQMASWHRGTKKALMSDANARRNSAPVHPFVKPNSPRHGVCSYHHCQGPFLPTLTIVFPS